MKCAIGLAGVALGLLAVPLAIALPLWPGAASDEPLALQGPFTWKQQRGNFGAVVQGTLKLRILRGAGSFTCFLTGAGQLGGQQQIGPTTTRIQGSVSMAAGTCSGTFDPASGKLAGTAQLTVRTKGSTTVHISAQGAQDQSQPINADSTDALILSGTVSGGSGHGTATYVKGGSFAWDVTADAGSTPPPAPPAPTPPTAATPPAGTPPAASPSGPPAAPPPRTKNQGPMPQADIDKLAAQKQADQKKLDQALADLKKNREFVNRLDEGAAKGVNEALKQSLEAGAKLLDQARKGASGEGPGAATKTFEVLDKLNKIKELIGDLQEVRAGMAKVDADVKAGKYTENQGRIINGTAVVGKTIKIVVDKVPVVGWAASEVVDGTFGVVIKQATRNAEDGARLECCLADAFADCCY